MYIQCSLEFILEWPKAIARPWWILQKIFFVTFKRFIPKQFFSLKINFSESTHCLRTASKNCSKTYATPCISIWLELTNLAWLIHTSFLLSKWNLYLELQFGGKSEIYFFAICTWPNSPVTAKILLRFQFAG